MALTEKPLCRVLQSFTYPVTATTFTSLEWKEVGIDGGACMFLLASIESDLLSNCALVRVGKFTRGAMGVEVRLFCRRFFLVYCKRTDWSE